MSHSKKGSLWNKWDLHVHTPASIYQKYGQNDETTWNLYLNDLEALPPHFKVLGINDYFFIDGYERLRREQKENGRLKNLTLLPVVEFRIDKFAGVDFGPLKRINLHVIFSNELSIETIRSQFLNTLEQSYYLETGERWTRAITYQSVEELGREIKARIPKEQLPKYGSDVVEGFRNLNINDEKIFEALDKDCFKGRYLTAIGKTEWGDLKWTDASIATKKSIINRVDLVFTAAGIVEEFNKGKQKLTEQGVNDVLLDCSDAHYLSSATDKDRIGNAFTWIKADPTFEGLKQVLYEPDLRLCVSQHHPDEINKKFYLSSIKLSDSNNFPISNQSLEINRDLVCIVGGRGAGKSALFETIAYCFDAHNTNRQDASKKNDSSRRYGSDTFIDHHRKKSECDFKVELTFNDLDGNPIEAYNATLQNRDKLCSLPILYLGQNKIEEFANDPLEIHRLAFETVLKNTSQASELASIKTQIEQRQQLLIQISKQIEALRKSIAALDEVALVEERNRIVNELQLLSSEETKSIIAAFNESRLKKDTLSQLEKVIGDLDNSNTSQSGLLNNVVQQFEIEAKVLLDQANALAISLNPNNPPLILDLTTFKESIQRLKGSVDKLTITSEYKAALEQINQQLRGKTDLSVTYLESQKNRENEVNIRLDQLNQLKESLSSKEAERVNIMEEFSPLYQKYADLYATAIQDFTTMNNEILKAVHLEATVSKNIYEMIDKLYEYADKRKARSYNDFITDFLQIDLENMAGFDFIAWIKQFKSDETNFNVFNGLTIDRFDEIVYANHYALETEICYAITPDDLKPLNRLSLGQKGTVLLKFYLSSGNNCPILIDQPEDHLDNDFIYHDLVKTIRAAKIKRQIIIVTHDANLVVNGDADQVIVAKYENQAITHELAGALENPKIRSSVSRILEGGKEAFQKRERKYQYDFA